MSWFADLAGKAEDLLNRVDQGAATALSRKENPSNIIYNKNADYPELQQNTDLTYQTESKATYISSAADNIRNQKATILAGTANVKVGSRTPVEASHPIENASVPRPSSQFVRRKKSEPDDELLFDFLNSSQKEPSGRVEIKKEKSKTPVFQSSRTATVSSMNTSKTTVKTIEENPPGSQTDETSNNSDSGHEVQEDSSKENVSSSAASTDHNPTPTHDGKSHELSNLRLENQLLRNEVQSLNQEMASLLQRSKETQEELNKARARVEKWNVDHSKSDRITRELRAQVDDLTEAVAAKDSQLAVLKVRLQEADQLLNTRTEALEALQSEKSRIMQDHSEGSSLQNQALQTLQERLHEADATRKREQESYKQIQSEFAARLNKMEVERQNLAEAVTLAERKYSDEKKRVDELQQQVKVYKSNLESSKQELIDYKQKATRILQSKEKLINSLKEGSGFEGLDSSTANSMELEELRHEKEMQKEEIQKLMGQIHQLRSELQDMEVQQVSEAESAREQLQDLQDQIAGQKASKQELEAELERQKQEFHYIEEDLYRTKNTLQSRIKDREEEIQKLRNQLTNKTLSNSSQSELENRLHQLTETLIQKQTMLESLSTEKNSLVFQLERLEQQVNSASGSNSNGSSINMSAVDSGEGTRLRNVPVLFNDTEMNLAGMYGKVRKAASSIDQFSIRLGIFLRRYPIARVFVIIYMALLHLWVMIVLLTYTPEMHHDQPHGK
ncbi:golgin subfamily A member 5 [Canis lupus baileyi]|uniref:Golgin subfamily A member 5 n=3 Tax=Canis lupus TaxID=9612 RepID=A0A8C0Z188_CANLF|nr:golgin subfamily A member 5 [Canis lupus familiaris]XP_022277493.1 golgin subfamily A member 5 [Canis lupus familiaris]XP_025323575.1 golgin subfamily A member 5 [Canis lupus dingo]XP_025323577.1 golgin subfamily A member 5 [Canis lupus dingo]XP_025323578.1 golgin subfamily A member 5 [Canis lupus dingo]XP_038400055.1 golgin subfamily A member 5 [Canis lupus familiaris]XP_038400056.1 golgin subfamily A member 5 [Canis lupus familiaris]XP_038400057.1 golgin subfamily A member 5 [Canis lupu|eukprot:XP_022277492.1 golgin subfamily A member 5 [Canis lupus familiaris]